MHGIFMRYKYHWRQANKGVQTCLTSGVQVLAVLIVPLVLSVEDNRASNPVKLPFAIVDGSLWQGSGL